MSELSTLENAAVSLHGLFRGDESKGSTVDFLVRKLSKTLVIRYSGFANASHAVCLPDGRHHCFTQFGSGTLAGAKTLLTRYGLLEPLALSNEQKCLDILGIQNAYGTLFIDENTQLITPFHIIANRCTMSNGHGTTGMGINETFTFNKINPQLKLTVKDIFNNDALLKLNNIKAIYSSTIGYNYVKHIDNKNLLDVYKKILSACNLLTSLDVKYLLKKESLIFESSQGILLDEDFGLFPHVTWGKLTKIIPERILAENDIDSKILSLGLTRTYATMHGNCPFPTFDTKLTYLFREKHNPDVNFQGKFRCGWLDLPALKYSIVCNKGVDYLTLSHLDLTANLDKINICIDYDKPVFAKLPESIDDQLDIKNSFSIAKPKFEKISSKEIANFLEKSLNIKMLVSSKGYTYRERELFI